MGNKTLYTAKIADAILARLAAGETLKAICRDEDLPAEATVRLWAMDDREGFAARYARARELGAYAMADEVLEIASGQAGAGDVQRDKLHVDTLRWTLSKVVPRVFGDKLDVTTQGERMGYVIPAPPEAASAVEWATQHKPR